MEQTKAIEVKTVLAVFTNEFHAEIFISAAPKLAGRRRPQQKSSDVDILQPEQPSSRSQSWQTEVNIEG